MVTSILPHHDAVRNLFADGIREILTTYARSLASTAGDMIVMSRNDGQDYDSVGIPLAELQARLVGEGWTAERVESALAVALSDAASDRGPRLSIESEWLNGAWAPSLYLCGDTLSWANEDGDDVRGWLTAGATVVPQEARELARTATAIADAQEAA